MSGLPAPCSTRPIPDPASRERARCAPGRRDELDILRGTLLVLMALTHLPTGLSVYSNQPFGFVSAAEGFVFLSAFLVGLIYSRKLREHGSAYVREKLLRRAGKLYLAHLGLLLFLFTLVAGIAVLTGSVALHNHLSVFFATPLPAALASPVLLYQPPLLDILPMYIVFLALSPCILAMTAKRGWGLILVGSGIVWLCAQLGGRRLLFDRISSAVGFPLPLEALGAFDWLAWQLVWIAGLWLGARTAARPAEKPQTATAARARAMRVRFLLPLAAMTVIALLYARYYGGFGIDLSSALVDKWHLGLVRIVNFAALGYLVTHGVLPHLRLLNLKLLSLLGRASLAVFTAHVPFCVLSRGLIVDDATSLTLAQQALVVIGTLGGMLLVAWRVSRKRPPASGARREASEVVARAA
ncbi:MAG: OpgC domain-containing protein [Steroidobacteraceae bacterium]